MSQRITLMLDNEIVKKLRKAQSQQILKNVGSVSFSRVVNETLDKAL